MAYSTTLDKHEDGSAYSKIAVFQVPALSQSDILCFGDDPRYTLTAAEKEEVIELKRACDEEGIVYDSIFELAKYCLVSSSVANVKKRRLESLSRIRKRRQFEAKHNLQNFNIYDSIQTLQQYMPDWAVTCGQMKGKWCVGYTSAGSNPSFMKVQNAFEILCKVEMTRYDLAASDLQEARNGFYLVGTAKDLKASPTASLRMAASLRVLFDKMHSNRIKGLFFEVPTTIAMMSSVLLSVLPSKVKSRLTITKCLTETNLYKDDKIEFINNMNVRLGGKYDKNIEDWCRERGEYMERTKLLVKV